jgi:two-component system phosphate regulon sensor histidine kinase PhoR
MAKNASKNNELKRPSTGGHLRWLATLMAITILGITGFQVYWLGENYRKEKENLVFRTNVLFGESVRKLQAKKLDLDKIFFDTSGSIRIEMTGSSPAKVRGFQRNEEVARLMNDIAIRINDSLKKNKITVTASGNVDFNIPVVEPVLPFSDTAERRNLRKKGAVITMKKESLLSFKDSLKEFEFKSMEHPGHPDGIYKFLFGVDSLQEPLQVQEIDSVYRVALNNEGIIIPFTIAADSTAPEEKIIREDRGPSNKVTIGFARPVTYKLQTGNTFGYLLKQIQSHILFSVFLVGVTILSFLLLYRNLLKQRRLAEMKNEFISNITHELKTPIATVGVAIEALQKFNVMDNPGKTKEYLDISQNELHRLSLLVDKVLKLSMFEKKEIELKFETLSLEEIVNEVVSTMKLQIEKNNAVVSVNADGNSTLQGDRLHLLSVIFNLLDNALKYGNGNTQVTFDIRENEHAVILTVADNGIGIPAEYKDKLFEKFFRVPAGNKHNTKGYGLGLSYVSHVVQKHKGTISVESEPGNGSKFIITLPKQQV